MIFSAASFHWSLEGVTHMKDHAIPLDLTNEPGNFIVREGSIKIRKDKSKLKAISVIYSDLGILLHTSQVQNV